MQYEIWFRPADIEQPIEQFVADNGTELDAMIAALLGRGIDRSQIEVKLAFACDEFPARSL